MQKISECTHVRACRGKQDAAELTAALPKPGPNIENYSAIYWKSTKIN